MISGHVFIATSLDGYIARPDGDLDWLQPYSEGEEDHGYEAFVANMDGVIMGRGSYEKLRQMNLWPYDVPVVVMSRQLSKHPPEDAPDGVWFTDGSPRAIMAGLERGGWRRAYVDGGQIIQSFLRDGLIADMIITRVPVLLGAGRPLFGALDRTLRVSHVETRSFPSGLVQSRYAVGQTA
ncbi:MAG: dihydrofolate reductase [Roseivivax sp.]|nr:dihydrofolate reductase [Roseivivax sp.]